MNGQVDLSQLAAQGDYYIERLLDTQALPSVMEALSVYGIRQIDMPATPLWVWEAIGGQGSALDPRRALGPSIPFLRLPVGRSVRASRRVRSANPARDTAGRNDLMAIHYRSA